MSTRSPFPPPGFDELPVEEKLKYVQSLWDRIAEDPDKVPVAGWQQTSLHERREARQAHPDDGLDWDEVQDRIRRTFVADQVTMILQHALQFPPEARAALASLLLESLDETVDENAEEAWALEIERRVREPDEGLVETIPWGEVRRKIQKALEAANEGRVVSQDEMEKRMGRWTGE